MLELISTLSSARDGKYKTGFLLVYMSYDDVNYNESCLALSNLSPATHIHYMFKWCPFPINPLSRKTTENKNTTDMHSAFWSGLSGLSIGNIRKLDHEKLYQWCLSGIKDLYPLDTDSISKMPPSMAIDFESNEWRPKKISQVV